MEESNSKDWGEELVTRRLIKQVEAETLEDAVKPQREIGMPTDNRGGDDRKEKLQVISGDEPAAGLAEIIATVENIPEATTTLAASETATAFAKVEKSLISLGFFTPSSR